MKLYIIEKNEFEEDSYAGSSNAVRYDGELYHEGDPDACANLANAIMELNSDIARDDLPTDESIESYTDFIEDHGWYCEVVVGEVKTIQTDIVFQSIFKAHDFCKNNTGHFIKTIETQD